MNERIFLFSEVKEYLKNDVSLFLFANGNEERNDYLKSKFINWCPTKCKIFKYRLTRESEEFEVEGDPKVYQLKEDFLPYIESCMQDRPKVVFIDITGMSLSFFGYCIFQLKEMGCERVYCGYTEPKEYVKKHLSEISEERFNLYNEFIGIKPLPGFLRSDKMSRKPILTLFLGFEGKRANYIFNEVNPPEDCTIPIIGLPAFQPGWQNYTYECNISFLNESNSANYIEYIPANSPFAAYNLLKEIREKNKNEYLIISPVGTRAHALGVVLYALEDEDSSILHDNPIMSDNNSLGTGNCYVYDISFCVRGA